MQSFSASFLICYALQLMALKKNWNLVLYCKEKEKNWTSYKWAICWLDLRIQDSHWDDKVNTFHLNVWFRGDTERRNKTLITLRGLRINQGDREGIQVYMYLTLWAKTTLSRQVMRIKRNISYKIISWSNTKFSKITSWELYSRQ